MIDFAIFAVTIIVLLLSLVFYLYPGSRRQTTVPGLDPSHPVEGNIADIVKAESFYQFLEQLHCKHGQIASFWLYGPSLAISVASPELIKAQDYLFEKPPELFKQFEPFVGEKSILFGKKNEARKQRAIWEEMFHTKKCDSIRDLLANLTSELIQKWSKLPSGQHISLGQYMKAFSLKIALSVAFGDYFAKNNPAMITFSRNFEICWKELEARSRGDLETQGGHRSEAFKQAHNQLRQLIIKCLDESDESLSSQSLLLPLIHHDDLSEETIIDELMTYMLKHYSISFSLIWSIYFLATNQTLQDDLHQSFKSNDDALLDKVVRAVFGASNVEQWTARINEDVDIEIDGHIIPKSTPIILKLAQSNADMIKQFSRLFSSAEKNKVMLSFGSAKSKRCCPAQAYSLLVVKQFVRQLIENLQVQLANDELEATPVYNIYSTSEEEIWITIEKRK